jgi:mannose-6-phosphate isomerase
VKEAPEAFVGAGRRGEFPLLVKFIDATQDLSVQVHPNDALAREEGSRGKTEAWYVLHAEPGAELVVGITDAANAGNLADIVVTGMIEDVLVRHRARAGHTVYIPAGTVHAIGKGVLLAEVQQSADITYRVYDYGRVGLDGRPRETHVKKAARAIRYGFASPPAEPGRPQRFPWGSLSPLVQCDHFRMRLASIRGERTIDTKGRSFTILMAVEGSGVARGGGEEIALSPGTTVLLPAGGSWAVTGDLRAVEADLPG